MSGIKISCNALKKYVTITQKYGRDIGAYC